VPLLDHFHKPTETRAPWASVGAMWVPRIVRLLNRALPRDRYVALAKLHLGDRAEADVSEFELPDGAPLHQRNGDGGLATLAAPTAIASFEPEYETEISVQVNDIRDDMRVVAAIEFVSPSNKDREQAREQFVGKAKSYIKAGIGLVVVDVVTSRHANLHNELMDLLHGPARSRLPDVPCHVAAYRGTEDDARKRLDTWPFPVAVGQAIPPVPLFLKDGPFVSLDLETTYTQALEDLNL
jgi:hypothetical protein